MIVASRRMVCAKRGDFENTPRRAIAFAWFVLQLSLGGVRNERTRVGER